MKLGVELLRTLQETHCLVGVAKYANNSMVEGKLHLCTTTPLAPQQVTHQGWKFSGHYAGSTRQTWLWQDIMSKHKFGLGENSIHGLTTQEDLVSHLETVQKVYIHSKHQL